MSVCEPLVDALAVVVVIARQRPALVVLEVGLQANSAAVVQQRGLRVYYCDAAGLVDLLLGGGLGSDVTEQRFQEQNVLVRGVLTEQARGVENRVRALERRPDNVDNPRLSGSAGALLRRAAVVCGVGEPSLAAERRPRAGRLSRGAIFLGPGGVEPQQADLVDHVGQESVVENVVSVKVVIVSVFGGVVAVDILAVAVVVMVGVRVGGPYPNDEDGDKARVLLWESEHAEEGASANVFRKDGLGELLRVLATQ